MVTLKQIATEVGVSIRTVSIALNGDPVAGRISETCVQQIQNVANKHGYQVSAAARAIRLKRTYHIGVLVRNSPNLPLIDPAAYETIMGINQQLEKAGYILNLIRYTDIDKQFASESRVFKERVLDGVISIGNIPPHCTQIITKAIKTCVWIDNNSDSLPNTVKRDEYTAGRLAAHHAIKLGYKNIYWIGGGIKEDGHHISVYKRLEGVTDRLEQAGIEFKNQKLPRWNPEIGPENLKEVFKPHNVFIAYNNEIATNVGQLATSMGYRIGRDFGLLCCEDSKYILDNWPGLSRVSFDRFMMGKTAADMMLKLLTDSEAHGNENRILPVRWIPGNTAWGPDCR
tara:strand:- start:25144 stop:26169 length:1026 start_codon:yes stop_codon:yes gene_type:complete